MRLAYWGIRAYTLRLLPPPTLIRLSEQTKQTEDSDRPTKRYRIALQKGGGGMAVIASWTPMNCCQSACATRARGKSRSERRRMRAGRAGEGGDEGVAGARGRRRRRDGQL